MIGTRTVLISILIVVATAGCGSDEQPANSTSTVDTSTTTSSTIAASTTLATTTTTQLPVTTTAAPETTVAPETTQPAETTTTTIAPGASLILGPSSLGAAEFGTDPEAVITYVSSLIGPPSADSGWTDAITGGFGICPGNEVRGVSWNDLLLLFSDNTDVASGRRHFFSYVLGQAFEAER